MTSAPAGSVDAVVVGSGPNGLAAAVVLARAGLSVTVLEGQPTTGGGVRTLPLVSATVPESEGLLRDVCAAVPAAAPTSAFFAEFDLEARGVQLVTPELSYAQPLDHGRAGLAWRDIERTADGLGADGPLWRSLLGRLSEHAEWTAALALSDKRSVPLWRDPVALATTSAAFGATVARLSTAATDRMWQTEHAQPLITGVMAHTIGTLPSSVAAGTAAYLGALAHSWRGWPMVVGGIGEITRALRADIEAHGGTVVTDHHVASRHDLPPARSYLFDIHARQLAAMLDEPWRSRLQTLRVGAGVCKLDYVLSGPVPWAHPEVGLAGTVHVGGAVSEQRHAESEVAAGRHADRPTLLLNDPTGHDPGRLGASGLRPLWVYAHVPTGSTRDVRPEVDRQLERFAPGFGDVVVDCVVTPAAQMSEHNASYLGGDVSGGWISMWRMVARPRAARDPYAVAPGVWLCGQSAPPGPGVHGMSGLHAARRVLRQDFGIGAVPSLGPDDPAVSSAG